MTDELRFEVRIDAPCEIVFRLLTTADGLREWIAAEATVDLRPGRDITWTHHNGDVVAGTWLLIEPPLRLSFSYGWVGSRDIAPGSTTVDVVLEPLDDGAATLVVLTHRGLPVRARDEHGSGWAYFLGELATVSAVGGR